MSSNLAAAMAESGERVALVDLDLQFGDIGLVMGLPPTATIYDLVASGGSLDAEKLEDYVTLHESGARVLQAPARPDQASTIDIEFLRQMFALLRATEDWVVVDSGPGFPPEVIASIDAGTDVCVVGTIDGAALKNTKLGLETLELMGVDPGVVKLVMNRADSRVGISPEDARTITGRDADVLIPSHRDVPRSANEGRPIVMSQPGSGRHARCAGSPSPTWAWASTRGGVRSSGCSGGPADGARAQAERRRPGPFALDRPVLGRQGPRP